MLEGFIANRDIDTILVGSSALSANGLVSGYLGYFIYTPLCVMDGVPIGDIVLEHYHVHDDYQLRKLDNGLYIPSSERAIIDTMIWYKENGLEGFLIEALQSYQSDGHSPEDLYECADHYLVPHEVVDYWWNEALEESDMSMG